MTSLLASESVGLLGLVGDADGEADAAGLLEVPKSGLEAGAEHCRSIHARSRLHLSKAFHGLLGKTNHERSAQFLFHRDTLKKISTTRKIMLALQSAISYI